MTSPAAVDVGDALDDLINQFSDSMSFFRELIQNALDAGSAEVEIDFEFQPAGEASEAGDASAAQAGAMVITVQDFGEGMDRQIIDSKLTRLFSSAKDGDMTKIGKFGIGFVSVFAIEPDAVCVDTARAGEAWRVLFDVDRNFKRLRLDQAMEGTTVRIIKNTTRGDYDAFVGRAGEVIRYWCRHARGEVRVRGELISEPFGLGLPLVHRYEDDFSHIEIGHDPIEGLDWEAPNWGAIGQGSHAYFNGGLTLVEARRGHGSVVEDLLGLSFKVSSRYLEHTLTRDDVIKDRNFDKVVTKLRELARGALRDQVFERIDAVVREGDAALWGAFEDVAEASAKPSPALRELVELYAAARWHIRDAKGIGRAHAKLVCARAPSGELLTWGVLRKAVARLGELWVSAGPTPLSRAVEDAKLPVLASFGGAAQLRLAAHEAQARAEALEVEHGDEDARDPGMEAVLGELWEQAREGAPLERSCMTGLLGALADLAEVQGPPRLLGRRRFMPLAPDAAEARKWASLANATARILELGGHKVAGCEFGRFADSGSLLDGRVAISQREFGELTAAEDAGTLGSGLFSRRRVLVVDADHPVVRTLLGVAVREPELAAYQLIKLFFLERGAIEAAADAELAATAMKVRELRCPKPQS
ncbi:hypothetical protein PPSIR1_03643 [Plesiocystis pacifica SIR-1]|uniref:Sacsin/Nov domain-containing protein n=1 Tax=Plesiocystis pacifica SIR-1 TaxID=391625 RepID=A6G5I8_9BACT|nr:ATP-binding protein [Plesiocystis pacifica]EDM78931.1 hypothetical protein PPSIR1_03643 [Plesiocystis pacifica SIR-1]